MCVLCPSVRVTPAQTMQLAPHTSGGTFRALRCGLERGVLEVGGLHLCTPVENITYTGAYISNRYMPAQSVHQTAVGLAHHTPVN
jgi:hypothetical protein